MSARDMPRPMDDKVIVDLPTEIIDNDGTHQMAIANWPRFPFVVLPVFQHTTATEIGTATTTTATEIGTAITTTATEIGTEIATTTAIATATDPVSVATNATVVPTTTEHRLGASFHQVANGQATT